MVELLGLGETELDIRQTGLYISRGILPNNQGLVLAGPGVAHNAGLQEAHMASSKRDQLISTAQALFYREGYHATGIDRILAESGVAKMTLYKYFKSKEELIIAVLEERHRDMAERMREARERLEPRDAILRTFDGLHAWIQDNGFCGCIFINAAAEFHDREHPIHQQAAAHKAFTESHFRLLLERLEAAQPEPLARQLQFLFEGALSMAHLQGPGQQAKEAKAAAESLLKAAGI